MREKQKKGKKWKLPKPRLSIGIFFTLVVMLEIVITVGLASIISELLDITFNISSTVWLWLFSIIIGGVLSTFVNLRILGPIKKLSEAMSEVANGNFDIRLEADSSVNEIKNIYANFNLMTKELGATEVLQTDFVSNVSHEIKTPINAIEGYAMLLQSTENIDETEAQYIDKILFNTKRLSELVGNILLLSKIDNQAIETKSVTFRLDEQIRQSIMLLEPKWVEKEIEFDVDLEKVVFTGNDGLLLHVWNNLIGNAIKFNPQGGTVKIRLRQEENRILSAGRSQQESPIIFTVEDEGPGISEESRNHIFDKFYQADSSHKQDGNGLGLALAGKILTMSGGEISVENLEEKGCRFTVLLNM